MGLPLPADVLYAIADILLAASAPAPGYQAARTGYVGMMCAMRGLSELCAPRRWASVIISSRRSMTAAKLIMSCPHIAAHVSDLLLLVSCGASDDWPGFEVEDIDALVALLAILDGLHSFELAVCVANWQDPALAESIAAAKPVFRRLVMSFALIPRPRLRRLSLSSIGPSIRGGGDVVMIPAWAIASIMNGSQMRTLRLHSVGIDAASLGVAAVRSPRLVELEASGVLCSDGVAEELSRCLGAWTTKMDTSETPWRTQRILLSGAVRDPPQAAPDRLAWIVGAFKMSADDASDFKRRTRRCSGDWPGFEVTCGERPDTEALIHAADATTRYFPDIIDLGIITNRLAEPTYGRALKRVIVCSNRQDMRDSDLEAVCGSRQICIDYYKCVHISRVLKLTPRSDLTEPYFYHFDPSPHHGEDSA